MQNFADSSLQNSPVVVSTAGTPPSDAVILFDGCSLAHWQSSTGGEAKWHVQSGALTVAPGTGDICTQRDFDSVQLHIEWRTPEIITDSEGNLLQGQARGNSGVFLQDRYEIQILDSYENPTYKDGQAAAIYRQQAPSVNVCRPPGVWQSFDIIYSAPAFDASGELQAPARVTLLYNGVLVHNNIAIRGGTEGKEEPRYEPHGPAPLRLQDHGDPVSFRNIWVRPL